MTTGEPRAPGRHGLTSGQRPPGEAGRALSSNAPALVPSTCVAGVLQCQEVPACSWPGLWGSWGPWEDCSVSCGGGEQLRSRRCPRPPCPGPARQSRICHTQVCRGEPWPRLCPTSLPIPILAFDPDSQVAF